MRKLRMNPTLPSGWNGLMRLSLDSAAAYWMPTTNEPIDLGATVFTNAQLPKTIYLKGDGCGTNEAAFSVVGLSDCKTNLALSIFGMNATLAGVAELDEESPGGFLADRSVHTNAPRTALTLEAFGPVAATGNVVLTWNSSVVQIYTAAAGGFPLAQFSRPYNGFTTTNLYVEGVAPGSNTLAWTYSAQTKCTDQIKVTVHSVDLVNAWERDSECNRVPNPKQNTDNRLFVATEGSGQTEIAVKSSIQPVGVEDKFLCAIYDGSTHLVSDAFSVACEAELNFTPTGPANNYLVKVGVDGNGNGTLESSEFCTTVTNFDVTAFTSDQYNDQRFSLNGWVTASKIPYPVGASLLIHFLNRTDMPEAFDGTSTVSINCFTQSNLTHNAGEVFASDGSGTLDLNSWNAASVASERIANSVELEAVINDILDAHKTEVTNYFVTHPSEDTYTATWSQSSVPVNFDETSYILHPIEYDLHVAFGHATVSSISINVVVKKGLFGGLYIDSLIETGTLDDLYDFNYEDGGFAGQAAVLQIGWDPSITGRDAGNIYFDRVTFQETFDDWDYDF